MDLATLLKGLVLPVVFIWTLEGKVLVFDGKTDVTESFYSNETEEERAPRMVPPSIYSLTYVEWVPKGESTEDPGQ